MPTVAEQIDETESHLTGIVGGSYNRLSSAISDTTTEAISLEFDNEAIVPGSVVGIGAEDLFVLEVGDRTITKAIRGFRGSTAATHDSGDLVQADPRFTRFRIMASLKQEVASWGQRLYAVDSETIALAADTRGYDLPLGSDFLHVLSAKVEPTTLFDTNSSVWPDVEFSIARGNDAADFASGMAIFFNRYLYQSTGRRVRVRYAKRFDVSAWTEGTDMVTDVGLATSMLDIPPLGAAWRLMIGQEIRRSEFAAQGQTRRHDEVPPLAALQTAKALKEMRDQRIAEEQLTLLASDGLTGGF